MTNDDSDYFNTHCAMCNALIVRRFEFERAYEDEGCCSQNCADNLESNKSEEAYERSVEAFHGSDAPYTLQEQCAAAYKLK